MERANYLGLALVLGHAALTWEPAATAALFLGGVALTFPAEAVFVRAGLLEHHTGPKVAGVPLPVLAAWPAVVYVFLRGAALVFGLTLAAAALAAVAATLFDAVVDPIGVREGRWSYPEAPFSEPRFRGVPWWNFVGWLLLVGATGALAVLA